MGLKSNQKNLHKQAQQLIETAVPLSEARHTENVQGRQTQRTVRVYLAPLSLPERWQSSGMTRIVWVKREGIRKGNPFLHEHFYPSNWNLDAPEFLEMIRHHWQIENGLHWVKDVTLKEDHPPRAWRVCSD